MKKILIFISIIILSACSSPKYDGSALFSTEQLKVIVTSDIHFFDPDLFVEGPLFTEVLQKGDGKILQYSVPLLDQFVENIKTEQADILIITGDLTLNGERKSHELLTKKLSVIESFGTKVFVIPGNHDINNPRSRSYGTHDITPVANISQKEFKKIYGPFGYDGTETILDPDSLSYSIALSPTQHLFMLDSNNNTLPNGSASDISGSIPKSTQQWMASMIEDHNLKDKQITVAMHHNLYRHSDQINRGFTLDNASEIRDLFKKLNISLVFSGHIHIQSIITTDTPEITSSSLSVSPNQYCVLNLNQTGYDYQTQEMIFAPNLDLDYKQVSEDYFLEVAHYKIISQLENTPLSSSEKQAVAELFSILNLSYFSGNKIEDPSQYTDSHAYRLMKEYGIFSQYIDAILNTPSSSNSLVK